MSEAGKKRAREDLVDVLKGIQVSLEKNNELQEKKLEQDAQNAEEVKEALVAIADKVGDVADAVNGVDNRLNSMGNFSDIPDSSGEIEAGFRNVTAAMVQMYEARLEDSYVMRAIDRVANALEERS
tara:strand:- start:245 stop:622 length:378 start_codon:yes stop_codon:yes gene_type:complete